MCEAKRLRNAIAHAMFFKLPEQENAQRREIEQRQRHLIDQVPIIARGDCRRVPPF